MTQVELNIEAMLQELEVAGGKAKSFSVHKLSQLLERKGLFVLHNTYTAPVTGRTHLVYRDLHSGRAYDCEKSELSEEQRPHVSAEMKALVRRKVSR